MQQTGEFTIDSAYVFDRRNPLRWIWSHVWRYKILFSFALIMYVVSAVLQSTSRVLIGDAANALVGSAGANRLTQLTLAILAALVLSALLNLAGSLSIETIAQRLSRDARDELYLSLLGKSQTFHDRQRVGDIMARTTDDVQQLNVMINPGVLFLTDIALGLSVPMIYIATVEWRLLLVPTIFVISYVLFARVYMGMLNPVVGLQRFAFGQLNAGLEETISGIEIVKASATEGFERKKFYEAAKRYRDAFAKQGRVEARYLPLFFFSLTAALTFLHAIYLFDQGIVDFGEIVAVIGLVGVMQFPIIISLFAITLVQLGLASGTRILEMINAKASLSENHTCHQASVEGAIRFENVSFGYEHGDPILKNLNFKIAPGETVAIVGQTGAGKSTLTELINRTYDVTEGRILVDGIDVREWNLDTLRSQISRIEQDVFLFNRSLSENIAFGAPDASQERIEAAAKDAQAHEFILSFKDSYQTEVGERGVTQEGTRQRNTLTLPTRKRDP
ncbi:MAG: ABC transporter ATP-binding protein, partial [Chloroflexota bacterium]